MTLPNNNDFDNNRNLPGLTTGWHRGSADSDGTLVLTKDEIVAYVDSETANIDPSKTTYFYEHFFSDTESSYRQATDHDVAHDGFASDGTDLRWYRSQSPAIDTDISVGSSFYIEFHPSDPFEEIQYSYYNVTSFSYNSLDELYTVVLDYLSGSNDVLADHDDQEDTENRYFLYYSRENRASIPFNGHHSGYVKEPSGVAHRNDEYYLDATGEFSDPLKYVDVGGDGANAQAGDSDIAIGINTIASGGRAVAIGHLAEAAAEGAITIGASQIDNSNQAGSIVIGDDVTIGDGTGNAVLIGSNAIAGSNNDGGVAIGNVATVSGTNAVALGDRAQATADSATSIGALTHADGANTVAIGNRADAEGESSISIGSTSTALDDDGIALGSRSVSGAEGAITIGNQSSAAGTNGVAIGDTAATYKEGGVSVGRLAITGGEMSIAIGESAATGTAHSVSFSGITKNSNTSFTLSGVQIDDANAASDNSVTIPTNFIIALRVGAAPPFTFYTIITDSETTLDNTSVTITTKANQLPLTSSSGVFLVDIYQNADYSIALGVGANATEAQQLVIGSEASETSIHNIKTPHFRASPTLPNNNFISIDTDGEWGLEAAGGSHRSIYVEADNGDESPLVYLKHNTDNTVEVHTVDSEYAGDGAGEIFSVEYTGTEITLVMDDGENQAVPFDTDGTIIYAVTDTYTAYFSGSPDNSGNDSTNSRTFHEWNTVTIIGNSNDHRTKSFTGHTLSSVHSGKLGFTLADTDWITDHIDDLARAGDGITITSDPNNPDTEVIAVNEGFGLKITGDDNRELEVDTAQIATHDYVQSAVRNATRGEIGEKTDEHTLYLADTEHDQLRFLQDAGVTNNRSFIVNTRGDTVYQGIAANDDDLRVVQTTDGGTETVNANASKNWRAVQYGVYEGNRWDESDAFTYNSQAFRYDGDAPTRVWNSLESSFSNVSFFRNGHNSSSTYQVTARVQLIVVDSLDQIRLHDGPQLVAQSDEFEIDLTNGQTQATESPIRLAAVDSDHGTTINPGQYLAVRWACHIDHYDDTGVSLTDAPYLVWSGTSGTQTHHAGRADVRTLTYELYLDSATGKLVYGNNTRTPELLVDILDTDGNLLPVNGRYIDIHSRTFDDDTDRAAVATGDRAVAIGVWAVADSDNAVAIGYRANQLAPHVGVQSIAIGLQSRGQGDHAIGIGDRAQGTGSNAIALGRETRSGFINSIALGAYADPIHNYECHIAGIRDIRVDTDFNHEPEDRFHITSRGYVDDKIGNYFDTDINRYGIGTGSSSNIIEFDTSDPSYNVLTPTTGTIYNIKHIKNGVVDSVVEVPGDAITAVAGDGLESAKWQWLISNQTVLQGTVTSYVVIGVEERLEITPREQISLPNTPTTQREAAQLFRNIAEPDVAEYSRLEWDGDNGGYSIWFDTDYSSGDDATHYVNITKNDADVTWDLYSGTGIGGTFLARKRKVLATDSVGAIFEYLTSMD